VLLPLELASGKAKKQWGVQRRTCSRVEEENEKSCREGMYAESRRRKMGKSAREGCMQSRRRKK
jgi:hypothetical protein